MKQSIKDAWLALLTPEWWANRAVNAELTMIQCAAEGNTFWAYMWAIAMCMAVAGIGFLHIVLEQAITTLRRLNGSTERSSY